MPTTNACSTSGCAIRNASISPGATMKWLMRSVSFSRPLKIVRLVGERDAEALDDGLEQAVAAAAGRPEAARAQRRAVVAVEVGMREHRLDHRVDRVPHGAPLALDEPQRAQRIVRLHQHERS